MINTLPLQPKAQRTQSSAWLLHHIGVVTMPIGDDHPKEPTKQQSNVTGKYEKVKTVKCNIQKESNPTPAYWFF